MPWTTDGRLTKASAVVGRAYRVVEAKLTPYYKVGTLATFVGGSPFSNDGGSGDMFELPCGKYLEMYFWRFAANNNEIEGE